MLRSHSIKPFILRPYRGRVIWWIHQNTLLNQVSLLCIFPLVIINFQGCFIVKTRRWNFHSRLLLPLSVRPNFNFRNKDGLVKSRKSPPPWRGRVRVGVISCRISVCYFPLPLVPSRRGRGKFTSYETINKEGLVKSRLTGENRCPVFS